jgi:acyl-CoA-binding protein
MGDNVGHGLEDSDRSKLIGAFKMNALFQIKSLSQDDAKQKYIDLVNQHIPE